ncbi:hypothetical protein LVJ94_48615 [Pendulispora rubella]|uniref:Uncharacterized protein n=1 Tax=Pendulispora rubella TaxID=2741070 RepID=A0ABZ2L1D2_9BACT
MLALLLDDFFLLREELFFFGTLPPARRASESPIATACFLLVTFFPERPERRVPDLRSCMALATFEPAFEPYLRPLDFFAGDFFADFFVAIPWVEQLPGHTATSGAHDSPFMVVTLA